MTKEELSLILQEGENYKIEFKENVSTDFSKEIVSFTNSSGGRILIGVNDDCKVIGVTNHNSVKSKIHDTARNCDPAIFVTIESFDNILIVNVPEGPNKPYRNSTGFFIRNGANSQKLTTAEIVEFLKDEGRLRFDEIVRNDIPFKDVFDNDLYNLYLKVSGISDVLDTNSILTNLSVLVKHEEKHFLNNAGILTFCNNPTRYLYHCSVVCALYKGVEKVTVLDRKELTGSIIQNIDDAIIFLKKHLKLSYEIKATRRVEILEIPEIALREAVINAICHRDYFEKGANVMIEIFDNRVDITNPGGLPKTLNPKDFGKRSVARNPIIASLLQRANFIEKMGTGIHRIRKAMENAKLPEPKFEFGGFFSVSFNRFGYLKNDTVKIENDTINEENDTINEENDTINVKNDTLKALEKRKKVIEVTFDMMVNEDVSRIVRQNVVEIIATLLDNPGLNSIGIAEKLGVKELTIKRYAQNYSKLFAHIGSRKTGGYFLTDDFEQKLKQANASK